MRWLLVGWVLACGGVVITGCTNADGASCKVDSDCASESSCVYNIAAGCASPRTCQKNPSGAHCDLVVEYCACDGTTINVGCDLPSSYARAPVSGPSNGATCESADGGGQD